MGSDPKLRVLDQGKARRTFFDQEGELFFEFREIKLQFSFFK